MAIAAPIPAKFASIQVLRGIAAMLVVFAHLQVVEQRYGLGDPILPGWLDYGQSSVDLFFVISGFVIATVSRAQFRSLPAAGHFLFQRVTRIYPPYWLYSAIVLLVWLYRPGLVNAAQGHQIDILASFLLLPQDLLPLLMVGWTLTHEMYFYLVVALLLPLIPERAFPLALAAWAAVVILGQGHAMLYPGELLDPTLRLMLHPLTLEFIGGAAVALLLYGGAGGHGRAILALGIAGFILAVRALQAGYAVLDGADRWRLLWFGVPALLVTYGAARSEIEGKLRFPAFMRRIGDASYSIYLSHILVLSAIGRLWPQALLPYPIDHVATLAAMLLATLGVGWLSYRWVEVPILQAMRHWSPTPAQRESRSTAC